MNLKLAGMGRHDGGSVHRPMEQAKRHALKRVSSIAHPEETKDDVSQGIAGQWHAGTGLGYLPPPHQHNFLLLFVQK